MTRPGSGRGSGMARRVSSFVVEQAVQMIVARLHAGVRDRVLQVLGQLARMIGLARSGEEPLVLGEILRRDEVARGLVMRLHLDGLTPHETLILAEPATEFRRYHPDHARASDRSVHFM